MDDERQHLANAARAGAVKRFVFTSTGLVYGSTGGRLAQEDDPCAPTAAYPVSKLAAERFLLALEGLDVRVLRLPFVYGDGDPHIAEVVPMMRTFPPTVGAPPPDGTEAERARTIDTLMDGRRIRQDLGFKPEYPRLDAEA
jgi:UDP-glucose 4-epimerase